MTAFLLSLVLAVAAYFVPTNVADPVARVLVPAIALMATGIFPCMSLAVGSMKGEQRTPALIDQLFDQLRTLLKLLVTAFAIAVSAVVSLAIVVALANAKENQVSDIFQHLSVSIAALIIGMLGGRVIMLGRAFFAILDINRKHSLLVARSKIRGDREKIIDEFKSQRFPADTETPRELTRV